MTEEGQDEAGSVKPGRMKDVRRAIAFLLALASLTPACGDDEAAGGVGAPGPEATTTVVDTVPGDAPSPTATGGTEPADPEATAPGPTVVQGMPGTADPGATPGPEEGPATTVPSSSPASAAAHEGPPGSFADVLLRPQPARDLFLEVLVQAGARPSAGAVDRLAGELTRASGKPVTTVSGVVDGDRRSWSAADIRSAADSGAGMPQGGTGAVVRLLYLRGTSSDAEGALGVAVRGDVAAVFADEVRSAATPLIGSDAIERAVTLHEVGHLLGLVDLFLATGRGDPEHPGHSPSRDSVMYWSVETGLFADLAGDLPHDFDAADLADLATIRGG